MPFLIADKRRNNKKRKVDGKAKKLQKDDTPKTKKRKVIDEEITSESDSEVAEIDVSSSEDESPDEIRKRAALKLLEQKRAMLNDDKDLDEQLRDEHMERKGKLHRKMADTCLPPTEGDVTWCHWCKLDAVTCVAIAPDCSAVFSGSKDGTIVKWSSATGEKLHIIHGSRKKKKGKESAAHTDDVLSLAISSDGKFLVSLDLDLEFHDVVQHGRTKSPANIQVSGGKDTNVYIWSPKDMTHIQTLTGHRSPIVSLTFRVGSHELFSCSERYSTSAIVNVWNLDEMALMYNLYAVELSAIDCLSNERPIAACGQKAELWRWKLEDQTYTIFSGRGEQRSRENRASSSAKEPLNGTSLVHCAPIDTVCYIDDHHAISGASDNSLAVWNLSKSRFPIATAKNAHNGGNDAQLVESWITAVAAVRYSDLVASGSHDGFLKFWKFQDNIRSLESVFSIPVAGFINEIEFSSDATFVVAGVGKQHRRGRWFPSFKSLNNGLQQSSARNGVCIIRLRKSDMTRSQ